MGVWMKSSFHSSFLDEKGFFTWTSALSFRFERQTHSIRCLTNPNT